MLALLALVLPRFVTMTVCLVRSWLKGLVSGVAFVWALAVFGYWVMRSHLLFWIALAVLFELATAFLEWHRKRRTYSADEVASWIPIGARRTISEIGFDAPIQTWDEDAVGRRPFVETILIRALVNCEPAIGITADFGEGKSSVLELIRNSIDRGGRAIAVPFRTWLPGSEATLLDSLFSTAAAAIRKKYFLPTWRSTLRRYRRAVLGAIPKSWEFVRDLLPPESQSQEIEELTEFFSRLPQRVVLLLDEVDRMHGEELAVLLKILRGAPELSNVSYICAFSKEALAKIVSSTDSKFGSHYLDKFFPVQLQLPRIDEDLRERLFTARLSDILESERVFGSDDERKTFGDAGNSLWHQTLESRLTNFRTIGQVIRGFQDSLHVLKNEVNVFDLLVIECVRLLVPSTYEFVYQNGDYFHDPPGGIERWTRTRFHVEAAERKKWISQGLDTHFAGLAKDDSDVARALLAIIFPSVKAYFREKSKEPAFTIADPKGERRISDANFFSKYFIYAVPETMFGEKEMNSFMVAIRDTDEETIGDLLASTLPRAERDDLRRIHFLRRLQARASQVPDKQVPWLAYVLAEQTDGMHYDHVAYQIIRGVVFVLAARFQGTPKMQLVLEGTVQRAGADRFASDIVYSSVTARKEADEVMNWEGFDNDRMKEALGGRMRLRHAKPFNGILPSNADDAMAFSQWRFYVPSDKPFVQEFLRSAFEFDIKNLGVFLLWLLRDNMAYPNGGEIKLIDDWYPISEIVVRLSQAKQEKVSWEPEQAAAVEKFLNLLSEESRPRPVK
jgi:hypothetical protein